MLSQNKIGFLTRGKQNKTPEVEMIISMKRKTQKETIMRVKLVATKRKKTEYKKWKKVI